MKRKIIRINQKNERERKVVGEVSSRKMKSTVTTFRLETANSRMTLKIKSVPWRFKDFVTILGAHHHVPFLDDFHILELGIMFG